LSRKGLDENSPAIHGWETELKEMSPVGTIETAAQSSLQDLIFFSLIFPAINRRAISTRPLRDF
jgi:hypothetical protein